MPIPRQNVLTDLIYETESGQKAEKRAWQFSFLFCSGVTSTLITNIETNEFAPRHPLGWDPYPLDLFLIELPIYDAGG